MRVSLAAKISFAVVGVLVLALLSSSLAIVSAYRFEALQETLVAENLASVKAAEELEIALLEQRGYVSSYILSQGDPKWLAPLGMTSYGHSPGQADAGQVLGENEAALGAFDYWLAKARVTARSDEERQILDELESVQDEYASKRREVVMLFESGQQARATGVLLGEVNRLYAAAFDLCERFIKANEQLVAAKTAEVRNQVERVTLMVTAMLLVTCGLGCALLWLFFHGVIFPLRRLSAEARLVAGNAAIDPQAPSGELPELGRYVKLLMADVAETRSDLQHSRTQLAHADKLAAVGRLAASVAHEIRNPLTSMKMWLYSLRRSIDGDEDTRQKIDVVSDEIARLESIVRSFLEFSRPPQLNLAQQDIGKVLDRTVDFLKPQLEGGAIRVIRDAPRLLPPANCDAEQLSQVFANLINNAVDAMPEGGEIHISCVPQRRGRREMLAVSIADTGCGIPPEVQQRLFEPFFTTKPEGTGLGTCIAASIMARHGGGLQLDSSNESGTRWIVWIPLEGASDSAGGSQAA